MGHQTEAVWKEFHKKLRQFIISKIKNRDDADDILQEVFIRIHNKMDTLRDNLKLESWIYQITRNAIIDYYRSSKQNIELPEFIAENNASDDEAIKRISSSVLLMIEELPDIYREALILTEFEGMKQKQLAESLGLSLPGAKSRIQRAREQLKQLLLDCCNFELDHYGNIIDYNQRNKCCKK